MFLFYFGERVDDGWVEFLLLFLVSLMMNFLVLVGMSSFEVLVHDVEGIKDPSTVFYRTFIHVNLNMEKAR